MAQNDRQPPLSCSLEETSEEEFMRSYAAGEPCYEFYRDAEGRGHWHLLPPIARA